MSDTTIAWWFLDGVYQGFLGQSIFLYNRICSRRENDEKPICKKTFLMAEVPCQCCDNSRRPQGTLQFSLYEYDSIKHNVMINRLLENVQL